MLRSASRAVKSTLLLAVLLIGCSAPGSEFVGKWVNSADSQDTLVISRNGDKFQIAGPDNHKMNATYTNGALHIPLPIGSMDLTYIKSLDTIQTSAMPVAVEYKRMK
jgi:hypothetical protein